MESRAKAAAELYHAGRCSLFITTGGVRWDSIYGRLTEAEILARHMVDFGVPAEKATWVLPPYEYYNAESVAALESLGMNVINLTPGTATNADYTTPDMPNYRSSDRLIEALYKFESKAGLNGAIILIHPGVQESRTDALYKRLPEMIRKLKRQGYTFGSFSDLTL
jgi:peptidoglycan/xylan/chitin deacetylase (PgdA/CDA1 family)